MDRAEHLQWCKDRAIELLDLGEYANSIASMVLDLRKHPDTQNHPALKETIRILIAHQIGYRPLTENKIREWIEGFN
jgi:hypothetical protein